MVGSHNVGSNGLLVEKKVGERGTIVNTGGDQTNLNYPIRATIRLAIIRKTCLRLSARR